MDLITNRRRFSALPFFILCLFILGLGTVHAGMQEEDYEPIGEDTCLDCHDESARGTNIAEDMAGSIHDGLGCLDCHANKNTLPHKETPDFKVGFQGCASCHEGHGEEYTVHGRAARAEDEDVPTCSECHGYHDVLPSSNEASKTYPANLTATCGVCHNDINLIQEHHIRTGHPLETYTASVHGTSVSGGLVDAATCNDCHSTAGTAHQIYSAGNTESSINHFNIPRTCGKCHDQEELDYTMGIHGQLVQQGDVASPVCTNCHGEHGIISPSDPRSPVSGARLAESTCTPCHDSISLTERYGVETESRPNYIDTYHGLKTKAGDKEVANCASCHGYHLILPSYDPESPIHAENLQATCGECHAGISVELASVSIHGVGEKAIKYKSAEIVKVVYIIAIIVIIGMMLLHWLIDYVRQITLVTKKPQVRRMRTHEVWQHTLLMVSFIVLVITGFALRYGDTWFRPLFGWDNGFRVRGLIHRGAAVVMIVGSIWHSIFLFSRRGRTFFKDMFPTFLDFKQFFQKVFFNLGLSKTEPKFKRFSYVEKAEYFALLWGNAVMILTGLFLWFDNVFVKFMPKGFLEVSGIVHFYEAILASLAIFIWHLYSTIFNPHVYPMNPSWITGKMPRDMFEHEHPDAEPEEV